MSIWSTFAFCLLPPALFLLVLMTVPFPKSVQRVLIKFVDLVLHIRVGNLPVFMTITLVSFVVLVAQTFDLQKRYEVNSMVSKKQSAEMGYGADLQQKASRWRAERNWWISALTFIIYWVILRFHSIKKEMLEIQQRRRD